MKKRRQVLAVTLAATMVMGMGLSTVSAYAKDKGGKTKITFDGYVGISNPWKKIDVMGVDDYALMQDYINGTSIYSSDGRLYYSKNGDNSYQFDDHKYFLVDTIRRNSPSNWWDAITRTGFKQQYNISVSGGNEKTKFMVSTERQAHCFYYHSGSNHWRVHFCRTDYES